ncbi:hypothetical protein Tco_0521437, partial [Tanacetum coccineum]
MLACLIFSLTQRNEGDTMITDVRCIAADVRCIAADFHAGYKAQERA